MDLLKTKIYLDKLNREFGRMSKDPDNIARIDVDIMASYVRELYDALLSEAAEPASKSETPPRKPAPPVRVEPVVEIPPVAPPPPLPVAPPPVVVAEAPPPVVEEKPFPKAEPAVVHKPAHTSHSGADMEVLFEEKQVRELSDKLSEMPVADLKRAIALNDRLLLTRELFGGDGQAFENTIGALNGFGNFGDARAYLVNNCVARYHWTDKKRLEVAKDFIKLVRRRYK